MNILGELPAQKGTVKVSGKLAYVSQQPWIFSGSVRQNIVFGGVFDKAKYDRIIKVSALKRVGNAWCHMLDVVYDCD